MNCPALEEIIMVLVLLLMVGALFGATLVLDRKIAASTPMKYENKEREHRYIDEDLSDELDDFISDERTPKRPRKD